LSNTIIMLLRATSLLAVILFTAACAPRTPSGSPARADPSASGIAAAAGAASSRAALEAFLAAVHAEDLQAMSLVWGTVDGPARARMPREELERRELVMICFIRHDNYQILNEQQLPGGQLRTLVELRRGNLARSSNFTTVRAKDGRWYVLTAELEPLRDFCGSR
jgi:hypothetical protein